MLAIVCTGWLVACCVNVCSAWPETVNINTWQTVTLVQTVAMFVPWVTPVTVRYDPEIVALNGRETGAVR